MLHLRGANIASYPVGGRIDSSKFGMDKTPLGDYYLKMFTLESTTGESIPQQYKRLFATRPFNEIKTGLNYRVSQVKLQKKVVEYFNLDGVNTEHFTVLAFYGSARMASMLVFFHKSVMRLLLWQSFRESGAVF